MNRYWSGVLGVWLACAAALAGCADPPLEFTEVKRLDERLTRGEVQAPVRIARALPEKKLPARIRVFAPPPQWSESRNLPVHELVADEQHEVESPWSVETQARQLADERNLNRLLRKEQMTTEQFVGLVLAVGMAYSKSQLRESQELEQIIQQGTVALTKLKRDQRLFSSLSQEGRYYVLQQASWLTRIDRAYRLKSVPLENVVLVRQFGDELSAILEPEFLTNPLDGLADLLEEQGLPFVELPSSGSDDRITWDRASALVGTDRPDITVEESWVPGRLLYDDRPASESAPGSSGRDFR